MVKGCSGGECGVWRVVLSGVLKIVIMAAKRNSNRSKEGKGVCKVCSYQGMVNMEGICGNCEEEKNAERDTAGGAIRG